jgi:hypothetical protein
MLRPNRSPTHEGGRIGTLARTVIIVMAIVLGIAIGVAAFAVLKPQAATIRQIRGWRLHDS